jgi:ABC-2 type transport system ATP-binding protein
LALDGVDWQVGAPGLVGLLGPNGAGKTTLMRILAGALPATDGSARVDGFDVFEDPYEVRARVGYLPETPPLYPELKVGEYLRFVAEIRGISRNDRVAAVGRVLDEVGLLGWEGRLLGTLSKGYRQRVGLAQALVHRPRLLILDEPTSGLDPLQARGVRDLIRRLASERLVVLSTHILPEVEGACDRIALIDRGRLLGDGTLAQLAEAAGLGAWLEVRFEAEALVADAWQALSGLRRVERLGPDRWRVEGDDQLGASVSRWAAARGLALRELVWRAPSLAEIFFARVESER